MSKGEFAIMVGVVTILMIMGYIAINGKEMVKSGVKESVADLLGR